MIPIWKNIPFLRLLLPLAAGILCGWYFSLHWKLALFTTLITVPFLLYYFFTKERNRFFNSWITGISINIIFIAAGIALAWFHQLPHQPNWAGHSYQEGNIIQLRLLEPLSEREKTYKALSEISIVYQHQKAKKVVGKAVLYFRKDSIAPAVTYGDIILVNKPLQEIKNAGNPGGFDYKRYALFNGITHQLFLQAKDYQKTGRSQTSYFWKQMYNVKAYILKTIRTWIKGEMESSVAEALLIGYRDDLDRDLVQAYSNTGVVHVIAISGMHLGLIYVLLLFLLKPLDRFKRLKLFKTILVLLLLWLFSLLTGAGASVLRAVIMFSFIAGADLFQRKGNIYNSMAASAFVLLCYNPFLLWDVGFQLSYAAVLSIVLFMKPIYHLISIQNKLLDKLWQLNAVTLSAQILTLPLCIYHFHQAPTLFLVSNLLAVPLSSFALYGLILLMTCSFFPILAKPISVAVTHLLQWMNQFILWVDHFTFAVVDGINHHPLQTILLYLFIAATAVWLIQKRPAALKWSAGFLCVFFGLQVYLQYKTMRQQKLIVYNLSQHTAIDFMLGNRYQFIGDSVLLQDGFLRNFHLKPSRIAHRTYHTPIRHNSVQQQAFEINQKKIIHINQSYRYDSLVTPLLADIVIVSGNPRLFINDLIKTINSKLFIFDSSNPQWKVNLWKKDCERLQLNYFCTSDRGAFVMNL